MAAAWLSASGDDLLIDLKVIPKSSRNEIVGERAGRLLVKVSAAPENGKANDAVCVLIAKTVGVPKSRVSVRTGSTSREKTVLVAGAPLDAAKAVLT